MRIKFELESLPPNSLLAINQERKIIAYACSYKRVLELSTASGVLAPWVVKASTYQGYPLYHVIAELDGRQHSTIINEEQKKGLLKIMKLPEE